MRSIYFDSSGKPIVSLQLADVRHGVGTNSETCAVGFWSSVIFHARGVVPFVLFIVSRGNPALLATREHEFLHDAIHDCKVQVKVS